MEINLNEGGPELVRAGELFHELVTARTVTEKLPTGRLKTFSEAVTRVAHELIQDETLLAGFLAVSARYAYVANLVIAEHTKAEDAAAVHRAMIEEWLEEHSP